MKSTALLVMLALAAGSAYSQQISGSAPGKANRESTKGKRRAAPKIASQVGTGQNIITHIAIGEGWNTSITIINLSQTETAVFFLNFFADDGIIATVGFEGLVPASLIAAQLNPGGSMVLQTNASADSALFEGWAQFATGTSPYVAGFAVFSNSDGNEAAVPLESDSAGNQILAFDNTNGFGMGVALVNSTDSPMTLKATFQDEGGNLVGTDSFTLDAMNHTAFVFGTQWSFTQNLKGTVYFEPTNANGPASGLAILGLRFTPTNDQGVSAYTSVTSFQTTTPD